MSSRLAVKLGVVVGSILVSGFTVPLVAASPAGPQSERRISTVRVGLTSSVSVLDSAHSTGETPGIVALGLETLMKIGPDGSLQPNLAQSVTRPTPAIYVYHLRKGVKFWDGSELTATDAANALNYYRYPGTNTASYYRSVKAITAVDRYTVRVTLKRPDASWQFVPALFAGQIFEKKFADAHRGELGKPGVLTMGTGPWEFDSLSPTSGLELSANPHYRGGKVSIQHISVKFFADQTSAALAMRGGEIDVVPTVGDARAFAASSGASMISVPGCAANYLSFNTQSAPWNDIHVRRAIAYAINRNDIIAATGSAATPITTLIPPSQLRAVGSRVAIANLLKSLPSYPFNLAKARQELAKSAHPNGFSASFTVTSYLNIDVIGQVIESELQKIGINLTLKSVPVGTWVGELLGAHDQLGLEFFPGGCLTPDPSWYPSELLGAKNDHQGGLNLANYTPPAIDDLLTSALQVSNPAKRLAAYSTVLKMLGTDVPYVPLYVANSNAAISNRLTWPSYNAFFVGRPWALEIKPKG
jgi:peptide/nickel transport system substrate-binding protein